MVDNHAYQKKQFKTLISNGKPIVNMMPFLGDRYLMQLSFYGTEYENSFGTVTIRLDADGMPVAFHDYYNFDVNGGKRSFRQNIKTGLGAVLVGAGGKSFSVGYNNYGCSK